MKSVISPGISETVIVELHSKTAPYGIVYTANGIISSSGTGVFDFPLAANNQSYYIAVVNPNTLRTWSAVDILFGTVTNYDFSNAITKAYGSNMKNLGDGNFALFSGDVNQDGLINIADYNEIKNATRLFVTGYLTDDLNGDSLIESVDFSLVENNIGKSIAKP